jgi:hypothetical protein
MAGRQRTADTPADGGRADIPAGGGQADTGGGGYTTNGHTCLRYGGRKDTEGAPTWRQGKVYQQVIVVELVWYGMVWYKCFYKNLCAV